MKKMVLLLVLIPIISGCAMFGTRDEYKVTAKMLNLDHVLAETIDGKQASPQVISGTYLLKVSSLSGGDNYSAGNCDESALVTVDGDRKITNIRNFPGSAKTCGSEESLKTTFWGRTLPAALLMSGEIGGSAIYGVSLPKNVGDTISSVVKGGDTKVGVKVDQDQFQQINRARKHYHRD